MKFNKCLNCIHFNKVTKTTGECSFLQSLHNYRFAYNQTEDINFNTTKKIQKPHVLKYMICDNHEAKL
ncbi:MAG: hypothetical protein H6553_06735 [Chitinophagales bacterium]|nr:hypothetical protein [Chitinophagales bacterium]